MSDITEATYSRHGHVIVVEISEGPRGPFRYHLSIDGRRIVCWEGDCANLDLSEVAALAVLRTVLAADEEDAHNEVFDDRDAAAAEAGLLRRILA